MLRWPYTLEPADFGGIGLMYANGPCWKMLGGMEDGASHISARAIRVPVGDKPPPEMSVSSFFSARHWSEPAHSA